MPNTFGWGALAGIGFELVLMCVQSRWPVMAYWLLDTGIIIGALPIVVWGISMTWGHGMLPVWILGFVSVLSAVVAVWYYAAHRDHIPMKVISVPPISAEKNSSDESNTPLPPGVYLKDVTIKGFKNALEVHDKGDPSNPLYVQPQVKLNESSLEDIKGTAISVPPTVPVDLQKSTIKKAGEGIVVRDPDKK
jgi:hypothetical protein